MSANRLTRLSITVFVAFLIAWALVAFFEADARATQHCIDNGGTEATCGWR